MLTFFWNYLGSSPVIRTNQRKLKSHVKSDFYRNCVVFSFFQKLFFRLYCPFFAPCCVYFLLYATRNATWYCGFHSHFFLYILKAPAWDTSLRGVQGSIIFIIIQKAAVSWDDQLQETAFSTIGRLEKNKKIFIRYIRIEWIYYIMFFHSLSIKLLVEFCRWKL